MGAPHSMVTLGLVARFVVFLRELSYLFDTL